jgi:hypothetical protein
MKKRRAAALTEPQIKQIAERFCRDESDYSLATRWLSALST